MSDKSQLHDYQRALPKELLLAEKRSFVEEALSVGLDPKSDFRHADLRDVSFDDCDIRNFDFTDADLRGATGLRVIYDASTILDCAIVDGSFLAYEQSRRQFFSENPALRKRVDILKRAASFEAINWIAGQLSRGDREAGEQVARALLLESNSRIVRTNMLFFLSRTFASSTAHREYLLALLAMGDRSPVSAQEIIKVLADFHSDDSTVFATLTAALFQADSEWMQDVCMRGLMRSHHFKKIVGELQPVVPHLSEVTRRKFTEVVATQLGRREFVREPKGTLFLDFARPVSEEKIHDIAASVLYRAHLARSQGRKGNQMESTVAFAPKEKDIHAQMRIVREELLYLARHGIPFTFSQNLNQPVVEPNVSDDSKPDRRILSDLRA